MRILNRLGGIELSQAYACIKAISKKKTEVIAQGRKQFIDGAIERGLDQETATKIFDLIEFFGGYGFNKSHSTAYALVAVPDGLPQGALPDRVHGRLALLGDGRRRAREVLRRAHRRLPQDGDRGPPAEHQRGRGVLQGRRRGEDPLRPRRDQGGRAQGDRGDRRGAGRGGAVHRPRRPLRTRPARHRQPGVRRGADQGRRVRRPRRQAEPVARRPPPRGAGRTGHPGRPPARPARPLRRPGAARRRQRQGERPHRRQQRHAPPWRACPTSPSCPTSSGWPRRRRCSASTCRATP